MPASDPSKSSETIRFKDVFGVFVLSPDDVQFRTGSISGTSCVVSDPERRGLLGPIIQRLFAPEPAQGRPWNEAEIQLLDEIIPQLQESGIVESNGEQQAATGNGYVAPVLRKPLQEACIAILGHGVLGGAVRLLLKGMPCGPITMIESSSVARAEEVNGPPTPRPSSHSFEATADEQRFAKPRDDAQWIEAVKGHDWVIAAQDCFEPEELGALNQAALRQLVPWSLVCFDGYEGWVGPTFVPGQTACFGCFSRRLFAGAAEPKHVFMDPRVRVYRVPSPWSAGPETGAWVSLISSIFALELIAAIAGRSFTFNHTLIVHRLNLTFQRESVVRLPRCPLCSPSADSPTLNVFSHMLGTRPKRG